MYVHKTVPMDRRENSLKYNEILRQGSATSEIHLLYISNPLFFKSKFFYKYNLILSFIYANRI